MVCPGVQRLSPTWEVHHLCESSRWRVRAWVGGNQRTQRGEQLSQGHMVLINWSGAESCVAGAQSRSFGSRVAAVGELPCLIYLDSPESAN